MTKVKTKIKVEHKVALSFLMLSSLALMLNFAGMAFNTKTTRTKPFTIPAATVSKIDFNFKTPSISVKEIKKDGVFYDQLVPGYGDYQLVEEVGYPAVPFFTKLIALPYNAENIQVKVSKKIQGEILENVDLMPIPKYIKEGDCVNESESCKLSWAYEKDSVIYNKNINYPNTVVSLARIGFFRNQHLALIKINPYQYNPVKDTVEVIDQLDLILSYTVNPKKQKKQAKLGSYSSSLKQVVVNSEDISTVSAKTISKAAGGVTYFHSTEELLAGADIDYLIITHDDFIDYPLQEELYDLASYRANYDGYHVGIASLSDIDSSIFNDPESDCSGVVCRTRSLVRHAFNNWATAPEFLLLLGDAEWVLPPVGGDEYYVFVDDNQEFMDWADIALGRLSVRTKTDISNISAKIQEYEQGEITDEDNLALFITGYEVVTDYPILGQFEDWGYDIMEMLDYDLQGIIDNFSSTFLAWWGHGSGSGWYPWTAGGRFDIDDIPSLNNNQTPFILAHSCNTGDISPEETSISEGLVLADNRGAVGYYGHTEEELIVDLSMRIFIETMNKSIAYQPGPIARLAEMTTHDPQHRMLQSDPALHLFGHRIVDGQPELAVGKMDFDYDNQQVTVEAANVGTVAANNILVQLYDSPTNSHHPLLRGQQIISLAAKTNTLVRFDITQDYDFNSWRYKAVINPVDEPGYTHIAESFLPNNISFDVVDIQPIEDLSVITYMRDGQLAEDYTFDVYAVDEAGEFIYHHTEMIGNGQIALFTLPGAHFYAQVVDLLGGACIAARSDELIAPTVATFSEPVRSYVSYQGDDIPMISATIETSPGYFNSCSINGTEGYFSLEANQNVEYKAEIMGGGGEILVPVVVTPANVTICEDVNGDGKSDCCLDGTALDRCSSNAPYYCSSNVELFENCQSCGCPRGMYCNNSNICDIDYEIFDDF